MLYELVTVSCPARAETAAAATTCEWIAQGSGRLLGVWRSEFGGLFQIKLLRAFDTAAAYEAERERALMAQTPFGISDAAVRLQTESYTRFPFLPDVEPRMLGNFYEFRTYLLKPGGLPSTLTSWRDAIGPAREYTAHLVVNMFANEGPPRITHIWGFTSLEERAPLRAKHYADGLWPPKGAPDQIASATSMICIPEPLSPLR